MADMTSHRPTGRGDVIMQDAVMSLRRTPLPCLIVETGMPGVCQLALHMRRLALQDKYIPCQSIYPLLKPLFDTRALQLDSGLKTFFLVRAKRGRAPLAGGGVRGASPGKFCILRLKSCNLLHSGHISE